MRVAVVVPRFYPCQGGYESYAASLAIGVARAGHCVAVFTTNALDLEYFWLADRAHLQPGSESWEGIQIHRFPVCHNVWRRRAGRLLGFVPFWRWQARFRSPNFCVSGLSKALQDFDADVIHIGPLPYCGLMYAGVEAAESGAKLVSTPCTHFGPAGSDFVSRHYTQPFQIQLLKCCNSVFTLTRLETERLEALGIEGRRLIHSGIGIEPESVTGGNSAALRERYGISGPLVLQLGMKAPEKGTLATFQAMQILWDKGVNVTLVLAGRSLISVEQWLKGQAAPAGKFLNLGAIDETQKRDLLSAADVLVQPSAVESFGLTTLEAWANAKPVIAADLPVSREIITEGQDGLIVPFGNSDALAQAIEWLISAPQKSRAMGERGRKKLIRNYNGAAVIQRLISHIIEDSSN